MKILLLAFYILLFATQAIGQGKSTNHTSAKTSSRYLPNRVIVKLKTSVENIKTLSQDNDLGLKLGVVSKIEQKFPAGKLKLNAAVLKKQEEFGLNRIYELVLPGNRDIWDVITDLRKNENVEYAEPVFINRANYSPNDTYISLQSYLNQIKAPLAWDLIRNDRREKVVIAIVDSGSDTEHDDLAANIYLNNSDPVNGKDDDGDGYIDNYKGWDFVGASGNNITEDNNPNIISSNSDHGLHVSGIASAVTDNAKGVASVASNCAKLMILKTAADDNGTDILRGYEAVKYAADHGAQIINCSWGSESTSFYGQDIINYAISKGCLIVAAAGNEGSNVPQYPAAFSGVLAVANVQSNDVKNSSSNYGSYISLAAPGTDIISTVFNKNYNTKTGTSMASPVVASAAALVKAYFPNLSMQQVGEQIRVTTDNIDQTNPVFAGQLGKGRLNVYRALTESQPSIKKQAIRYMDNASGTFAAGDTITLYVDIKNFLNPVSNLTITLKSSEDNIIVTNAEATIPNLGTLGVASNIGPFKFFIKPETPENYTAQLRLEYSTPNKSYIDFEGFTVQVNRDYLNLQTSTIATTVTSNGKLGFLQAGGEEGTNGFQYKGEQLLYEAGLMIGSSSKTISNNVRTTESSTDDDFVRQVKVSGEQIADTINASAAFNDNGNPDRLNVYVKQKSYIISNNTTDNFLIIEYEVFNQNNITRNNVYIGMFNDWDVNGGATNATQFDTDNKIAYVYDKGSSSSPYAAVKLLSNANPAYYPLSNRLSGNLLVNDNFTDEEKFLSLSSGIAATELGTTGSGTDVSFVTGYGPFTIPANSSIKVAFAYIGADNLDQVYQTANVALSSYNLISRQDNPEIQDISLYTYYDSGDHLPYVSVSLPERSDIQLDLYNMLGQKVNSVTSGSFAKGKYNFQVLNTESLASGPYFYKLRTNGRTKTLKTIIIH
ncbi:S8 family serine peptidase [Desertivirga arenae]|uniref:S8 family serine peptidase n=1 Tax=Desertivirga arenae TaxID=2810309 RepID=UPI001A9634DE|nr:S8 family serine peptidase [Pedobacter sp. SYSU D00823]